MKTFPSVAFALVTFAVGVGAHLFVLRWARRTFRFLPRGERWPYVVSVLLAAVPTTARVLTMKTQWAPFDALMAASLLELTFVLVSIVPLSLVLWGARSLSPASPASPRTDARPELVSPPDAPPVEPPPPRVDRRRALEAIGGLATLGGTGMVIGWGTTVGRHDYRVYEEEVRIPGLPRALDGYVIAQVSDLHSGLFTGERELREGGARVRAMKPDLVVATGDLVDFDARHAPRMARALADLAPRDGVYAILGNHDYYAGADAVGAAVRAAGVKLLVNQGTVIRPGDGGGFALLGVDDQWAHRYGGAGPHLRRALAGVPQDRPRILLSHQPETFESYAGQVALQLSGHTHGGQIRPANLVLRWAAGRYDRMGSALYVNRGFGVAGPPARLGVPPEITRIVLVAA